jgi:hypothetical protein
VPSLTVVAANVHNAKAAVAYLRRRSRADALEHYDVALVSEAHKRAGDLRKLLGHDYYTGPKNAGTDDGPDRMTKNLTQDCGILLDRRLPWLGGGSYFMSPADPGSPHIGHERWGRVDVTEFGATKIALICLHPIPKPTGPERRERYVLAMRWLEAVVTAHRAQGHEVIAGGDLQVREHDKGLHSPRHVFANHDMDWHWHGIDAVAWTPGLTLAGRPVTVPKGVWPSDHPLLRVRLQPKPRRSR